MLKCVYIVDSFTLEWFVLDEQIDGGNKQEWWDWEDSTQGSKYATHDQIPKGGVKKNMVFIHILWISVFPPPPQGSYKKKNPLLLVPVEVD